MFKKAELDDRGEVPAPFNVEKHNFNPHRVRGDFEHDRNGKPIIAQNDKGNFVDKKGKKIQGEFDFDKEGKPIIKKNT